MIVLCLSQQAFGNVVELRINTKGTGGKIPNFGFVVFDDSEPVQRILGVKVRKDIFVFINVVLNVFWGDGLNLHFWPSQQDVFYT